MIRLIAFIFIFAIFIIFIVLNLGNKSDVSFGFKTFNDIPVFITAFSSFVLGMLFTLPFVFFWRKEKKKSSRDSSPDSPNSSGGTKKSRGRKNKKSPQTTGEGETVLSETDMIKKENSSYGID